MHLRIFVPAVSALLLTIAFLIPGPISAESEDDQSNNLNLYGIASHAWWLDPDVHGDELFDALDDLSVTTVRVGIDWKRFEREQGTYDFSKYDRVFGELADRDIEIIANFNTIPAWASVDYEGCSIEEQEPSHCELREDMYEDFENAMRAAVERYSWIDNWEYWNEPEMWAHFNELTYLEHLRIFYDVVQDINPDITVAACTLVGPEYMEWLYNVAEEWYGEGNYPWDAIAYHPYNEHGAGFADPDVEPIRYDRIEELRELMVERSGPEMKMWITEYGWHGDPRDQADNLVEVLDWMREQPYIEFAHLHMLHDWHETDEAEHYGLMSIVPNEEGETVLEPGTQFEPKPYFYETFRQYPRVGLQTPPDYLSARTFPELDHATHGRFIIDLLEVRE